MVQQSNSNSHGVRGVRRADPTAEDAQTARSLSMALEVKGGMRPAMYTVVVITSNTRPDGWYRDEEQGGKRTDALLALWDRLGFRNGNNTICRTCGTYLEPAQPGAITRPWLESTRTWFMNELAKAAHLEEHEELSDEALSQVEQDKLEDDIASLDV